MPSDKDDPIYLYGAPKGVPKTHPDPELLTTFREYAERCPKAWSPIDAVLGPQAPKTDPELLARLLEAAKRPMTAREKFEQRVSFVWGQMSEGSLTKAEVRRRLAEHGGYPPEYAKPPGSPDPVKLLVKALDAYDDALREAEAIMGGEYAMHHGIMFELADRARELRARAIGSLEQMRE